MRWAQVVLLSSAILLLVEGLVFLRRATRTSRSSAAPPPRQFWSGWLLIAVAVLAFLWFLIRVYGWPVFSFEFGALMVRGSLPARVALPLLLALLPVATLLAWWMSCHPYRPIPIRGGNGSWLTAVAIIVGLVTALQVHSVGPGVPGVYGVYSYDLWSPPLILWLVFCLTGCILGIFRSGSVGTLLWSSTSAITAVALYAWRQPVNTTSVAFFSVLQKLRSPVPVQLAAASSETLWGGVWMLCIGLFLPLGMALSAWELRREDRTWLRCLWAALALVAGVVIIWQQAWQWWLLYVFVAVIHAAHRRWSCERTRVWNQLSGWQRFLVALLLVGPALALMATSQFAQFDMTVGLLGVLLVLIGLAEVLARGPLVMLGHELGGRMKHGGQHCQSWWQRLSGFLSRLRAPTPTPTEPREKPPSLWAALKGLLYPPALVRWVVLAALAIFALVFVFELPNAGKTIIVPFEVAGMEGDDRLGGAISDQLADALGVLQRELRPDLLTMRTVTNRVTPDSRVAQARYTPTAQKAGLSSAVPREANLELGSVKLPFQVLISPFEPLVRKVLRVHVISGSLHEYESHYTLMARDSDGRTWTVSRARESADAVEAEPAPEKEDEKEEAKSPRLSEALPPMMEELAFDIVREEPLMAEAGLTRWWEAFEPFRRGLWEWERSERDQNAEARAAAIDLFQEATRLDPGFALAHYRLGRALQQDGQPARAVESLRNAVQANPQFLPGHVALGFLLYDNSNPSPRTTVASPTPRPWSQPPPGPEAGPEDGALDGNGQGPPSEAIQEDALETWHQTIQQSARADSLDEAQAYYGLCLAKADDAFKARVDTLGNVDALLYRVQRESGGASGGAASTLEGTKAQVRATAYTVRLAYFYCKRAELAYDDFPRNQRESQALREGKAQVLNALGTLLERSEQQPPEPVRQERWECIPEELRQKGTASQWLALETPLPRNQARAALKYYARAAELSEHPVIQCNAASAALLLGDSERMERLALEPAAHVYRAGIHLRWAKQLALDEKALQSEVHHRKALLEYQRAVELDPSNIDALNGFAYAFWQWQYHSMADPDSGPEPEDAVRAEQYARRAVALAQDRLHLLQGIQVQSTLGEVLLGRARPNEAIEVLKRVDEEAPAHPFFDEVRWDLAQAYLCDAHNGAKGGMRRSEVEALRAEAVRLLEEVQRNDLAREDKLFPVERGIHMAQMVDPTHVQQVCTRLRDPPPERGPGDSDTSYVLRRGWPRYAGHELCDWVGVEVDVFDSRKRPVEGLTLHIWGGGLEARSPVGEAPVQLGFRPQATRDYYFVQLEDAQRRPASEVHALQTHANDGNGRCTKNLVRLVFDQQRLTKRAPG